MLTRRELVAGGVCGVGSLLCHSASAKKLPFCGFSIAEGWTKSKKEFVTRQASSNDASGVPQIVNEISQRLGIKEKFLILITEDEDNAYATVAGGKKILGIDVNFLSNLNTTAGTKWSAIQVIAHEVGHHIAGFDEDSHRGELNADYWSGQALARLKSSRNAAQAAILAIGSDVDTNTHPNKKRRAQVIARGWDDAYAGKIDKSFCLNC